MDELGEIYEGPIEASDREALLYLNGLVRNGLVTAYHIKPSSAVTREESEEEIIIKVKKRCEIIRAPNIENGKDYLLEHKDSGQTYILSKKINPEYFGDDYAHGFNLLRLSKGSDPSKIVKIDVQAKEFHSGEADVDAQFVNTGLPIEGHHRSYVAIYGNDDSVKEDPLFKGLLTAEPILQKLLAKHKIESKLPSG